MTCRACGRALRGQAASPWITVRGAAYHRCAGCGHVRLEDARAPSAPEAKARYELHRNDPAEPGYRRFLMSFIDRAVAPFVCSGARILDFGSGPVPALSVLLRERGMQVSAYDPFYAPDRRSLRGPFDLVAVHEVIEHLARPYATLAALGRRLRPGGIIAIRTRFPPLEPEAFARSWYREDRTHVGFFGPPAFAAMAARIGAALVLCEAPDLGVLRLATLALSSSLFRRRRPRPPSPGRRPVPGTG